MMLEITCEKSLYLAQIMPKSKANEVKKIKTNSKPGIAIKATFDMLFPKKIKTNGKTSKL